MLTFLILTTRYLSCAISMSLTSLFALSFADSTEVNSITHTVQLTLLIGIGVTLDVSKYVFWFYKQQHRGYGLLSCGLVIFSCIASIAFFVTHQQANDNFAQESSPEYQALRHQIALIQREIALKERLANQRLESRYHDQWDESERLQTELQQLRKELQSLVLKTKSTGLDTAQNQGSSAFFSTVARTIDVAYSTVVVFAYSTLAIFIELCSLGLISIRTNKQCRRTDENAQFPIDGDQPLPLKENDMGTSPLAETTINFETTDVKSQLKQDVIAGKIHPTVRNLIKTYRLKHHVVKNLLSDLVRDGHIQKTGNRYFLITRPSANVK